MRLRGSARFGVSLVYKVGDVLSEMRFTNMIEQEARDTLKQWGNPNDIKVSKEDKGSKANDTLERAQELVNKLRIELGFNKLEFRKTRVRINSEHDQEIGLIRKALKQMAPTLSVRKDRGTAYGWINVRSKNSNFTDEEKRALEALGLKHGSNWAVISPDARRYFGEKVAQIRGSSTRED